MLITYFIQELYLIVFHLQIAGSQAYVVDASVEFQGQSKAQFVATAALATSYVDDKSQVLFFFNKIPARSSSDNKQFQVNIHHLVSLKCTQSNNSVSGDDKAEIYE
jgi:hypothetical protein